MKANKIIVSGLAATSLMTLFSYIVSAYKEKNFKEPQLLAALEKNALPAEAKSLALPAGWSTHFGVGIVWAGVYEYLWQNTDIKPTLKSGLVLGGLSGVTGVLIWRAAFKMHPDPPRIEYGRFFGHLILAHLVYGIAATMAGRERKKVL
jgi:hypothetical protein